MNDLPVDHGSADGPPPMAAPGPIVQSAAIGFRAVFVVTLLLGLAWLGSNFHVISSDSQAVVLRFGRIVHVQRAGLLLAWPRPIEEVRLLPGAERQLTDHVGALPAVGGISAASSDASAAPPPATAAPYLTGDGAVVLLDAVLVYRINDPAAFVLSQKHLKPAIDRMFRAAAVNVAAGQRLNDFLVAQTSGDAQSIDAIRGIVRDRLLNNMNGRLKALDAQGDGFGVEIERIDLTAYLPPEAKLAFDSVLTASQKADQNVAAANTAAELRRQGAQREADRRISAAQAVALERTVSANVETTSIVAIERTRGATAGLEQQAYRSGVGDVLRKAGTVIVVDPQSGQRMLITGPSTGRRTR